METIIIPQNLSPVDAINCSKHIIGAAPDRTFKYDFSEMQHCHPFGLLLLGNAIRYNRYHYKKSKHLCVGLDNSQSVEFASDLGFFQYAGWDIGRKTSIYDYGVRHIPIKQISVKDLQAAYPNTFVLGDIIDQHAYDLAFTLTQDKYSEATKTLQYCLREMIRNTFEHGKTESIWVCGLYWPTRNEAEIALLDEGCGVFTSLSGNRRYKLNSHMEANKLALQPGASRMLGIKQDPYDVWQNSGYGLFMASALCALGGYFILCSGDDATLINSTAQTNYSSDLRGTAICMNIKTDRIVNLQQQLNNLVSIGNSKARENEGYRILSASKVSTIASLIHKEPSEELGSSND